ncbi:MAG: DUF485 domain-containing protein [Bacteroidota bacterium]
MLHGPAAQLGVEYASKEKSRLGVILFIVYALVYGLFVAIGIGYTHLMGVETIAGLNLAVFYGFGLIILAIIMGFIYNYFCTRMENKMEKEAMK